MGTTTLIFKEPDEVYKGWVNRDEWQEVDELRKELKRKGEIDSSTDRHIRMTKAYWLNLPVRLKRSGRRAKWLPFIIEQWLDKIQENAVLEGVIRTIPQSDFSFRKAFYTLDEVYEYLKGSGLITEEGTDAKGRTVWQTTDYVQIVFNPSSGLFEVWIQG